MQRQMEFWPPENLAHLRQKIWKRIDQKTQAIVITRLSKLIANVINPQEHREDKEDLREL